MHNSFSGTISVFVRASRGCVACVVGLVALSPLLSRAGSIFDDDWQPPKSTVRPHAESASPPMGEPAPAPPTSNPAGGETAPAPQPQAAPQSPAADGRRPIPGKAEQARSRNLLKVAFAAQLKDRSLVGRKKLAQSLLDEVPKAADNPSDEFVLLGGAIDASEEAGALELCFQAVDTMAEHYDVDGLSIKVDAALKANLRGDSPAAAAENARQALDLIDLLLANDDFRAAGRIIAQVRPAAVGNPELISAIQQRSKTIETLRVIHNRVQASFEKLQTTPADPAENLVIGSYFCFDKGEWKKGLPLLARGSDANLKRLATREMLSPGKAEEIIPLGDGWWDFAPSQPASERAETLQHAASFYQLALPTATGLERSVLQQRIAAAAAAGDKFSQHRAQTSTARGSAVLVKKYIGEFLPDDRGPLFKPDNDASDILNVSMEAGSIRISGTKNVEAPRVLGRACGWLGKAVLLKIAPSRGAITVSTLQEGFDYNFLILFVDGNGAVRFQRMKLKEGTPYTWTVSQDGKDATLSVQGEDKTVATLTAPVADYRYYGFVGAIRSQGAHLDMKISFDDPTGK